jgi:anti-sigma-K factor RskA
MRLCYQGDRQTEKERERERERQRGSAKHRLLPEVKENELDVWMLPLPETPRSLIVMTVKHHESNNMQGIRQENTRKQVFVWKNE